MSTANEILHEIYGSDKAYGRNFEHFKITAFGAIFKGSIEGTSVNHRNIAFAKAIVWTSDKQKASDKTVESHRMLQWFCGHEVKVLRERINYILGRVESTARRRGLDADIAARYERYLSCIPELIERKYVGPEEEAFLDEYHAGQGILAELEAKIGAYA